MKRIIALVLFTGATLQLIGCATVVGKGSVSSLVGECTEGEGCASYCCVEIEGHSRMCELKSPGPEGAGCSCPITTMVGLRHFGGTVCTGSSSTTTVSNKITTPPVRDYKPLDYKKWTSGLYNDEFVGKAVIVEGYIQTQNMGLTSRVPIFGRPSSDISLHVLRYSQDEIRQAAQKAGPNSYNKANEMVHSIIPVIAPKSMRDQIFSLNDQQKVKIYGVVIQPTASSVGINVKAERIETVK